MSLLKLSIVAMFLSFCLSLQADEGMWLPSLLNKLNVEKMHQLGTGLTAEDIYSINSSSLKDAVIALNGGSCTGEIVSSEGLFLTNHHCGYSSIQKHSSEERNILRDGFWAKTKADELSNEDMNVSFLISVKDVTDEVLVHVTDSMSELDRSDSINHVISELVKDATTDNHYEANVKSVFSENQYLLFVYEIFTDVRLVGAPPHFIGKFGGDTDNWMWPRHTGDFSMFRVYTAPDGSPAEYSEENIPLKPRYHLPISLKGYKKDDMAMVMGYPGSTDRYLTSDGVAFTMNVVNNTRIKIRKAKLDIIKDFMSEGDKETIMYSSKYARSSNYYKYSIGQNRGLNNLNVLEKKRQLEKQFNEWSNSNDKNKAKYGETLALIENAYADQDDNKAMYCISEAFLRGPEIFHMAYGFKSLYGMLRSGDDQEVINRKADELLESLHSFFKDYDSNTDQKIVAALTEIYANEVVAKYQPEFVKTIQTKYKGNYKVWAEKIFKKSFLNDQNAVADFLANPKLKVLDRDPIFKITRQIYTMRFKVLTDDEVEREDMEKGYRLFVDGLRTMNPEKDYYPNANSTMRITYGEVGDYIPRDGVQYGYYTTLKGYIEKEIPGDAEFDVWPRMKELYYSKDFGVYADSDKTLHTCFTTNNDITGGNSGSPVINGDGELIGIAFDGNWEAMSGDIAFEPELQKCINVDIRFVLWVIDRFAGASHLVDEMTLVK